MAQPYLSQITMFGGNFAPKNYALCNGQLLNIQQYTALFSLLGTQFGGDGIRTFGLPNLQSALPIGMGQGPGLSNYTIGQIGGTPNVTLNQSMCPPHQHFMQAVTNPSATTSSAVSNSVLPGNPSSLGTNAYLYAKPPVSGQPALIPTPLAAGVCSQQGNNLPHSNLMPSLCITFIIALVGVFPTRN
jgi:microcystin-dependent protein